MKRFKTLKSYTLYTLLVAFLFCSCNRKPNPVKDTNTEINGKKIYLVEYDSCEYLIISMKWEEVFTHKGNCKYCLERAKNNCY
jgi:hypothetical protein